ncbi:hypothetical protein C1645_841227 [Glomus cerebriforme]|uniref:MULE transposase domain-containing protein n=1 Tax=Glomus cerebriforme TaxID=658196 RepID=A0A397S105_9GLOM|nr:hypothetical protein C1645_841227 [Glomus cerebriforme]
MDAAIQLKYPLTFSIYCIWHISQNLPLGLKSKLGELFEQFKKDFYECRNSLDQEIFEQRWLALCNKYPNAVNYLERSLYPSKASWIRAFSNNIFTIDIQTTSHSEEQNNNDYANWRDTLLYSQSEILVSNAFANINDEIKEFTTSQVYKIHFNEMERSFSYNVKILDQSYINNENFQDWSFSDDFIKKQEIQQITF